MRQRGKARWKRSGPNEEAMVKPWPTKRIHMAKPQPAGCHLFTPRVNKAEIAQIFEEIALLLELKNANPFRVRAYRNGVRALLNTEKDLEKMIEEGSLTDLPGIGVDLAEKIEALAKKGRLPFYEKLRRSVPRGLLELLQVHGLGAKKIRALYANLKIASIAQLKKACVMHKVAKLKGFGEKTEHNILNALMHREEYQKRHLWWDAMERAAPILDALRKIKGVKKAEVAGSVRRKLETIGDLDFLVAASDPKPVAKWFTTHAQVQNVQAKGATRSSVRLKGGFQADLRIVPQKEFGFALCYFTGSKEHNIKIRERARKMGWSLSEYGLQPLGKKKRTLLKSTQRIEEADIHKALGLAYIPPELRENMGEIEAAEVGKLPHLVEEDDVRGTFHNHTTASDGRSSLKEMVLAAEDMGWEYVGISDHSKSSVQAGGLSEERLNAQIEEIRKINASKQFKITIFAGTECDILSDGSLDFSDKILKKLDFVIASVHSSLSQDEETMTRRIIRAIEHPLTTMIGHVTGRLLLQREAYKVNVARIIDACIANHKMIELNGNPKRLDMDWRFWHAASGRGLLCCLNTDAHRADNHQFIRAAINIARKGWLEKRHIFNTRSLQEVEKYLKKK